jgi:hypothetical protein
MADECHDRFQDDVEAVVLTMLRNADRPIRSLEAWIADAADGPNFSPLRLAPPYEMDDRHLRDLAHDALRVIEARMRRGEDPVFVVVDVIETVFNGDLGTHDLGGVPPAGGGDEIRLAERIDVDRIIHAVMDILRDDDRSPEPPGALTTVVRPSVRYCRCHRG